MANINEIIGKIMQNKELAAAVSKITDSGALMAKLKEAGIEATAEDVKEVLAKLSEIKNDFTDEDGITAEDLKEGAGKAASLLGKFFKK